METSNSEGLNEEMMGRRLKKMFLCISKSRMLSLGHSLTSRPRGYKNFFMLNSRMLISIKISRNSAFLGSNKPRMLLFPLINVKMPTIVDILTLMSRKNLCSVELSMKKVL